jgi:PAS domain S-box-containing protein
MVGKQSASWPTGRHLLIYAALPLGYVICGRLGLLLAVPPGYATAVFLPAGIAVAATFVAGAATIPGIFVGSLLLNLWIGYSISHQFDAPAVMVAVLIAVASTLQAWLAGSVLRRLVGYPAALDNPRDLLLVLLLSPLLCLTSATLSVGAMWTLGVVRGNEALINWITWWVGDTLGVLVVLPLMLVAVGEPQRLRRSRARFVAVPMIVCFAMFIAIFARVSGWEHEESLLEFRMQSQRIADMTRGSLEEQALFLAQLSRVFAISHALPTRTEFRDIVQELLRKFPAIQAVEWAPRVLAGERAAFEAAQQPAFPEFQIREMDASGMLAPARDRNEFYPVTYVEPFGKNEKAVGFDLASTASRRAAIESSLGSAAVTATPPIRLVQEPAAQRGILLLHAVRGGEDRGVLVIALRMGAFMTALAEPLASTLQLGLIDRTAAQTFFETAPAGARPLYEAEFGFAGRRYAVQTMPSPLYLARHRGWQSWTVLAAGVLGTGLLGALLMLGTGHSYRFEMLADHLRAKEAELEAIINGTPFMLTRCSRDLRYLFVSEAYAAMIGRRPKEVVGRPIAEIMGEQGFEAIRPHVEAVLQGDRVQYEEDVNFAGIGTRALNVVYTPERDEQGRVKSWIASILDVTERKRTEEALRAKEAELETIVKRTPFILIRNSLDSRYRFVSDAYAQMVGRRPEEIVGKTIREIVGEEGFKTVEPYIKKVLAGERVEYEREVNYAGIGPRFLHGVYMPEKDEAGNVIGWIASINDITERKRAESQRDLLLAELSHRVKNTLATVISIAHLSFSKAPSPEQAERAFDERIHALAQTHARLADANWSGVSLGTIVHDETAPYHGANVRMEGPDIVLGPKLAVSLGMALHELATNAAKYGALTSKNGMVAVSWELDRSDGQVRLHWTESGGPSVTVPDHTGFGRLLLERALASDLNGEVKLEFARDGLHCLISFPLDSHSARAPTASPRQDRDAQTHPQRDQHVASAHKDGRQARVLIVEDEALLAMELEEFLDRGGYAIIGPFGNLGRAIEATHRETIDVALLDMNLNGEMVYPLADELSRRGIPFIFVTGYGALHVPERFRGVPRVPKPIDPTALVNELRRHSPPAG